MGSKLSRRRLTLQDQSEEKLGRPLCRVWAQRELKVLDLCSGLGSVPWTLAKLGIHARVFEVELDAAARKVAAARAPAAGAEQLVPHDIASPSGLKRIEAMGIDLVVGGFPCQSMSIAAPKGREIKADSRSGVFEAVRRIVMAVRSADPHSHWWSVWISPRDTLQTLMQSPMCWECSLGCSMLRASVRARESELIGLRSRPRPRQQSRWIPTRC